MDEVGRRTSKKAECENLINFVQFFERWIREVKHFANMNFIQQIKQIAGMGFRFAKIFTKTLQNFQFVLMKEHVREITEKDGLSKKPSNLYANINNAFRNDCLATVFQNKN